MNREMMKSKIHRATVTEADLHYVGSITIDHNLMKAADLLPNEKVDVVNISNGTRLSTYVISGKAGSGVIGINGAAARLVTTGDIVIIIAYGQLSSEELSNYQPSVVFVDDRNQIIISGNNALELPSDSDGLPVKRSPLAVMR